MMAKITISIDFNDTDHPKGLTVPHQKVALPL
jgi:hypothetical protein